MDKKIIDMLEEMDVPQGKIEEFIHYLEESKKNPPKDGDELYPGGPVLHIGSLQEQYRNETDPYKKAGIAAAIISYNLEN